MATFRAAFERQILTRLEALRAALTDGNTAEQEVALGKSAFQTALLGGIDDLSTALGSFVDITYNFPAVDFGAGDSAEVVRGPAGARGTVKAVSVFNVTEVFSTTTTEARVDVGDGTDADAYALTADFGALAVAEGLSPAVTQGATGVIPADDPDMTITFVAPTGGTPTGIADVAVTIRWYT